MTLRRGFKAESERRAAQQRTLLGLRASDPVDPFELLALHNITVRTPREVRALALMPDHSLEALEEHSDAWSALTVRTPAGVVVVHNPLHERGRQHSNLTHELAHVLLEHQPGALQTVAGCVMRDFDEVQEDEARWLGDTLLAPRAALAHGARQGMDQARLATWLGCSTRLVSYRAHSTGIIRQYRSAAR